MKFIKLTGYKYNAPTYINADLVISIDLGSAKKGIFQKTISITCVYLNQDHAIGVLETPEQILEMLK